ncbi:MAG TPA: flagellin [Acetobacteraceae bacterium]|nr:flagellin [Acetobacteraceae bacterium]
MNSILTNYGAMIALQNLDATNNALTQTQNQISSGLSVSSAADNASAWTISTTMQTNVASLNQVSTDLGNADSILGMAVSGAGQVTSLVSQIRSEVASYSDTSQNQSAIQDQVTQLVNQINATINSSSFNGQNLLNQDTNSGGVTGSGNALTFLAATNNSYTATGESVSATIGSGAAVNLSLGSIGTAGYGGGGASSVVSAFGALVENLSSIVALGATAGSGQMTQDSALATIDAYSNLVEQQAAQFGAVQTNVASQQTFVNNLANTLQEGIGNMIDANMTTESAKLSALQTQQQLGAQALSIANQSPQLILKLFNG